MAQVTYTIDLTPDNASKIDQVNHILIGGDYTKKTPSATDTKTTTTTTTEPDDTASGITLDEVKAAAKLAKKDHGEDFAIQVLKDHDVAVTATLGRSMAKIPEADYRSIITAWEAGPSETDNLEDDGLGDGLDDDGLGDDSNINPEAVKTALKAYSKSNGRDEAKAIMTANGAKALSNVDDCSQEQLAAMMKELT